MQLIETLNEGLKRGYEITITADELDARVNEKLVEAQPDFEMKGFRKGKVPLPLLKKRFGQSLLGEVIQESVDGAMSKHFEDSGNRPALRPEVKMTNEGRNAGGDMQVAITYEVLPVIPEVDLKSISLKRLVAKVDEAAVDEALGNLAETAQRFESREAGARAEDGDQIVMDFVGRVDGEAFDGGAADDYPLVLGSNSFMPDLEEQLVGVVTGEEKDVTITFPRDYKTENLAGKEAVFSCIIKNVKKPVAAELDDVLARKFGAEDLAGLKTQIGERLEAEYAGAARAVMKRELLDKLDELVAFDLPPSLVKAESGQIARQLWHEENPEVEEHDRPDVEPTDEHNILAERRVRLGLLLAELGQKAEVEVTDSEMNRAIMNHARQYPGQERQFFEFAQQNQQIRQQLRAPIFESKVVDYIIELAEVTDNEVSKHDLQKAVEALGDG
ncbi:MAG: trigger factor [Rhodobacteraceae bacterium]|nr:trigger factor [Paracoccaceae bacterium]